MCFPEWGAWGRVGGFGIGLGSGGARNSRERLEMMWKKIKNPSETPPPLLYALFVAIFLRLLFNPFPSVEGLIF